MITGVPSGVRSINQRAVALLVRTQAATGGHLQTALMELRVVFWDIELITVGCPCNL
ncbi:MAG: hypothetical protein ACKO6F_04260 [Cyanobium sp.]